MLPDGIAGSFRSRMENVKHPLLAVILAGLAARLAIMAFALVFDSNYWAIIIRNINAGGGLYDIEGYFYTPVWGYVLGLVNAFSNAFLEIGEMGFKIPEIAFFEQSPNHTISIVTTLAFNYCSKAPLILFDLAASLAAWKLAMDMTGDRFRSVAAFSLVWLSLTVMGSSGIIGMPDSIGAAFMMLSLLFLVRRSYFIMGMCFALASATKFFPVFLFLPMVFYVLAAEKGSGKRAYALLISAAGVLSMLAAVFLPQLASGDIAECFRFLSDRTGFSADSGTAASVVGYSRIISYVLIGAATLLVGLWVRKGKEEDLDRRLMEGSFLCMTFCMLYPPAPQYVVSLIPLLALHIAARDRRFLASWAIIWISSGIIFASTAPTNLLPLSLEYGWPSIDAISDMFVLLDSSGGLTDHINLVYVLGFAVQYIGIASIPLIYLRDRIGSGRGKRSVPDSVENKDTVI